MGTLHIEGATFPVDQFYLEDLVEARLRAAVADQQQRRAKYEQQQREKQQQQQWDDDGDSDGDEADEGGEGATDEEVVGESEEEGAEGEEDSDEGGEEEEGEEDDVAADLAELDLLEGGQLEEAFPASSNSSNDNGSGNGSDSFQLPYLPSAGEVSSIAAAAAQLAVAPVEARIAVAGKGADVSDSRLYGRRLESVRGYQVRDIEGCYTVQG